TFNLEFEDVSDDNDAVVKVNVMRGAKTAEEYFAFPDGDWWFEVYQEVEKNYPSENSKFLVIPSYTRYDEVEQKTKGHTALGGGNLALFGGGDLFTWPDSVEDALSKMTDSTKIDTTKYLDDSVGRTCVWGAASTCIGAALHELGHTLGLPHTTAPNDIMTRGFDNFYRVFLVREAPSAYTGYADWTDFSGDEIAEFSPVSAAALVLHPFFTGKDIPNEPEPNDLDDAGNKRITLRADDSAGKIIAEAKHGVGYVAVIENGDTKLFKAPTPKEFVRKEFPEKIELPYSEIMEILEGKKFEVRMLDSDGYGWDTILNVEFNP
ncbi:MAG: matrixin family metalloprotease, partial [Thermoguttaceae bacterium]